MNINIIAKAKLPTIWAEFSILVVSEISNGKEHLVLSLGDLEKIPLLRIHSQCLTGDALFSLRCDCGSQLQMSLKMIADKGNGLLIYMAQEGRGIGLGNKIKAYELQDQGLNTIEANEKLGFEADQRDYSICGERLAFLNIDNVKLLSISRSVAFDDDDSQEYIFASAQGNHKDKENTKAKYPSRIKNVRAQCKDSKFRKNHKLSKLKTV